MRPDEREEWDRVHLWTRSALDRFNAETASESERRRRDEILKSTRRAAPIVKELQEIGIPLWDLGELGNVRFAYPAAVPVLIRYLNADSSDDVALSIVHALTKPYGASAFGALCEFLQKRAKSLSPTALFAVGNALAANAKRSDLKQLLDVVSNPKLSLAREPIALVIARWSENGVKDALQRYLRDGESPWTAIRALRLAKAWTCAGDVEKYCASDNAEVRNEAKKFMQALEKTHS